MDDLFKKIDSTKKNHLYQELAPLYDFIYSQHYNYREQFEVIREYEPTFTTSVLEGACGTGRLLEILESEERYNTVAGFDINGGMLELARTRITSSFIKQAGFTNFSFDQEFDLIVVLGNSISHLIDDQEIIEFMDQAKQHLSPNGRLIFDYLKTPLLNGQVNSNIFESDDYKVERTILSTIESENVGQFNFAYDVADKHNDQHFQTGESMKIRAHNPETLKLFAEKAGLAASLLDWESKYTGSRSVENNLFIGEKK